MLKFSVSAAECFSSVFALRAPATVLKHAIALTKSTEVMMRGGSVDVYVGQVKHGTALN